MSKCIICGRHGLFLKLNTLGQCESCAYELEQKEIGLFNDYYTRMLHTWNEARKEIDVGEDPIKALDYIPQIQSKIEMCDSVLLDIKNVQFKQRLVNQIMSGITYRDDFAQRHMMGDNKEWGIHIYADPIVKQYKIDDIFGNIEKEINNCRTQWVRAIKAIENNAEYKRMLDNIPLYEVHLSDSRYGNLPVSELDELVKYSSITAKSDINKLGCFVAIDTETTGLSCKQDHLVEVAAVRFEDWTPVEKFHSMINPGIRIPFEATRVNGITDEMVKDAPVFDQIIDSLNEFIGKSALVGHNLSFDLKFLYHYGLDFTSQKRKYYDTCEISKKTLNTPKMKWDKEYGEYVINDNYPYDVENYKLVTLCEYYGLRDNSFAHRALSDAYSAGDLFRKLIQDKTNYYSLS